MTNTDHSIIYQPKYIDLFNNGTSFRVYYNRRTKLIESIGDEDIESKIDYIADYVDIRELTKECFIQQLMQLKYPSIADEIALINNFQTGVNIQEYNQYQEYRSLCKDIANSIF